MTGSGRAPLRFVLVRGLAREAGHWPPFDAELRARWPDATLEFHDLAGNGTRFRERSVVDVAAAAADLRARVWASGEAPPVIVAISLGAMVGLEWCRRWPGDPLRGLVAINTSVGGLCRPWQRMRPLGMLATLRALTLADAVAREQAILALTSRAYAHDRARAQTQAALHATRPIARANAVRQVIAAARFRADPGPVRAPLLWLNSAGDRLVDPICSRLLVQAFGGTLAVHPDGGHDLGLDDPRWCVSQIAAWLRADR